ncbi:unknown protein [Waddlia chondrophila 2032/99]|uniref:Uncharacterized protein n=1 Tax=Waddlia chondrophila 2032/99 TaxID=765953 RepID=F8LBC8_9BACT|nr:unknown protein [Waddlia chondrophila 2032/99]
MLKEPDLLAVEEYAKIIYHKRKFIKRNDIR